MHHTHSFAIHSLLRYFCQSCSPTFLHNFHVICFQNVCNFWPSEEQPQMNPVPYLTVIWKAEDKSLYWRTHTLHLVESNAPVSTAVSFAVQHLITWWIQPCCNLTIFIIQKLSQYVKREQYLLSGVGLIRFYNIKDHEFVLTFQRIMLFPSSGRLNYVKGEDGGKIFLWDDRTSLWSCPG